MTVIKTYNIKRTRITLVWKYRYSKNMDPVDSFSDFRDWRISLWFRKNKIVGKRNFSNPKEWGNNLVNDYMLGFELLIFKGWIDWHTGGINLEIK